MTVILKTNMLAIIILYNYSLNIHDSLDLNYLSFKTWPRQLTLHWGADWAGGRVGARDSHLSAWETIQLSIFSP